MLKYKKMTNELKKYLKIKYIKGSYMGRKHSLKNWNEEGGEGRQD